MASVTIDKVQKSYGTVQVLQDIDLDIRDGEFVVLVGPSGCGKSTLLRMIAGLEEVTGGDIRIGERVVNDVAPKDRDIAMVFQSYALYPHMDVARNMGFSLSLKRADKGAIGARVGAAARRLGLQRFLDRLPRQLSGGQRQRVAMGRAIVRDPAVFLFDEPLSNLDAKLRVHMRAEVKALHQQLKTTSVYVTHDQIEAMTMADRIVVMSDGAIQQVGAPLALYDRPANRFVAGFIGSPGMNFLACTHAGGDAVLADGQRLPLPANLTLMEGDRITIGIRPEHLVLNQPGGVQAEVGVVEPLGLSTQFYTRVGTDEVCVFSMGRPMVRPGDRITLSCPPGMLHLFDDSTGLRIEPR